MRSGIGTSPTTYWSGPRSAMSGMSGTSRRRPPVTQRPESARLAHSCLSWRRSPYPIDSEPSAGEAGTSAHVKGFRTPASQWRDEMLGGRRPKSLRGGNRGGVCAGSGVGLWRFSLCMPRSLDIERGSRPSNHRGVGFGRRVQDWNGGLVVSDLRFGGRRRD
jgi:hypothetical protein